MNDVDLLWLGRLTAVEKERDLLQKKLKALQFQVEIGGCAVAHDGEFTYECRHDHLCGLCRLRTERDKLEREYAAEKAVHALARKVVSLGHGIAAWQPACRAKTQAEADRGRRFISRSLTATKSNKAYRIRFRSIYT